ncbi:MAG: helicase C-terminal domain-containing protein [Solirubrobacterales bacterium]
MLANRYDGIDLPGEACRLLVLDGLPVAVNHLERFLYQRLAATGLLGERMRTRLTQGVGRATRGEGDWCAVLVSSREAYDLLQCPRPAARTPPYRRAPSYRPRWSHRR